MKKDNCIFCKKDKKKFVYSTDLFFVVRDGYPVTKYHTLIIPYRHVANYFDLTNKELNDLNMILKKQQKSILDLDKSIKGFNIGINAGIVAGQTIMHCHIHLIPRREGDVENPQGGVRGVIPSKQHYIRKSK